VREEEKMATTNSAEKLPGIVLSDADHASLMNLATEAEARLPGVGEPLLTELERAEIVAESRLPSDIARMGSQVLYRSDDGQEREVTLVYPAKADIAEGRISVMTPIGAALIGMKKGASINWTARDGRTHRLTVLRVRHDSKDAGNVHALRPRSAPHLPFENGGGDDPGPQAA
jgi:regulator of nucleoside diphosphate kinase